MRKLVKKSLKKYFKDNKFNKKLYIKERDTLVGGPKRLLEISITDEALLIPMYIEREESRNFGYEIILNDRELKRFLEEIEYIR